MVLYWINVDKVMLHFQEDAKVQFFSCDPLLHHAWILQTQLLYGKDKTTYILS